jgi:glutamine synthetase
MNNVLEYIWIGGSGELRSKIRVLVLDKIINDLSSVPTWNYDGSSTGQTSGTDTEITLIPVKIVLDPFKRCKDNNTFLVLCSTYNTDGTPALNNNRDQAVKIFNKRLDLEPWYGLEQEYFMIDVLKSQWPYIKSQTQWYCGIGNKQPVERLIAEEHLENCIYSGLQISGINAEVAPYQWEYQIGPCEGIEAGDQHILSRYILERVAEKYGIGISYKPKPYEEINGSGCHTNFSTRETRTPGTSAKTGLSSIYKYIELLASAHQSHIEVYGEGNESRLTGYHETASIDNFSYGIGTRNTSIRIPNQVAKDGYGYLEDRRPASNIDPYLVTSKIFKTCCL